MCRDQEMPQFVRDGEAPARRGHAFCRQDNALCLFHIGHQRADETIDLKVTEFDDADRTGKGFHIDRRLPVAVVIEDNGQEALGDPQSARSINSASLTSISAFLQPFSDRSERFPVPGRQVAAKFAEKLERGRILFLTFLLADQIGDGHREVLGNLADQFDARVAALPRLQFPDMGLGNADAVGNLLKRLTAPCPEVLQFHG
jgi:hypothetical protein